MAASDLIKFKRGTLAKLQTLQGQGEDGCFYLTIDAGVDSSRLYIGRSDGSIVPVNQGIVKAASVAALEANTVAGNFQAGDFAYVEEGNILAVRSGNKWVQINNAVDTYVSDFEETVTVSGGVATITGTVKQNGKANVSDSFNVAAAGGITLSAASDTLTITGDQYEISRGAAASNASEISLTSDQNNNSSITLKGGSNVTITTPADGQILVSAADNYADSATIANQSNGFKLTLGRTGTLADLTATWDPQVKVGVNTSKQETVHFASGTAALPVYTKTEVDEKFVAVNAMVYKGTIGTGGTYTAVANIPSASIGDTYKIVTDGIVASGNTLKTGDVIIANGTEGTDGIISGTITWDVIPAGDDINNYTLDPTTHGVILKEGAADKGSFALAAGTSVSLSDNTSGAGRTVTVSHANVTRSDGTDTAITQTAGADQEVTVVSAVTTNAQGHVTAVKTRKITVKDSVADLTKVSTAATAASNVATVTTTVGITPYSGATEDSLNSSFKLESDNLTVTATSGTTPEVKMNFTWGSF